MLMISSLLTDQYCYFKLWFRRKIRWNALRKILEGRSYEGKGRMSKWWWEVKQKSTVTTS